MFFYRVLSIVYSLYSYSFMSRVVCLRRRERRYTNKTERKKKRKIVVPEKFFLIFRKSRRKNFERTTFHTRKFDVSLNSFC